jgi:hypothetical protein
MAEKTSNAHNVLEKCTALLKHSTALEVAIIFISLVKTISLFQDV